jgi:hypothetical protein
MSMDPFHEGERRVQQRVGEMWEADRNSPMIAAQIPAGAIPFLQQQSLLILAVLDKGAMWCLPIVGKTGWMSASRDAIYLDLAQTIGSVDERILSAAADRQLVGGVVLGLCHDFRPLETSETQSLSERPWTPAEVSLPETPLTPEVVACLIRNPAAADATLDSNRTRLKPQ